MSANGNFDPFSRPRYDRNAPVVELSKQPVCTESLQEYPVLEADFLGCHERLDYIGVVGSQIGNTALYGAVLADIRRHIGLLEIAYNANEVPEHFEPNGSLLGDW